MIPNHHKELATFLRKHSTSDFSVNEYIDNNGNRPIPISQSRHFFSTIGVCDMILSLPEGNFEFAATGSNLWLPNALVSSIYSLTKHNFIEWPLVCEDAVKVNAVSTYRHMAYVPSDFSLKLSTGQVVKWLMGVPVTDNNITISRQEALEKAQEKYPEWLFSLDAKQIN